LGAAASVNELPDRLSADARAKGGKLIAIGAGKHSRIVSEALKGGFAMNALDTAVQQGGAAVSGAHAKARGETLELQLADGRTLSLSAETLWRECPSAQGKTRRMRGLATPPRGVRIVAINEIGNYAINIVFSDGHDRGIYPWEYLLSLARRPRLEDFIIAS
jgi:DUF971 family protein